MNPLLPLPCPSLPQPHACASRLCIGRRSHAQGADEFVLASRLSILLRGLGTHLV